MSLRVIALLAALAGIAPSTLRACLCQIVTPAGARRVERAWSDRPMIFIGHVLEADQTPAGPGRQTVRFVTEASWRNPMADTVTLIVGRNAPCAEYAVGGRYLVLADTSAVAGSPLVTAPCDFAWGVRYPATVKMLAELGPPAWNAPPTGSRALDARAKPLGTPIGRTFAEGTVVFIPPRQEDIARFEIGDWSGTDALSGGPLLYAQPGLYQFRITWTDGSSYASYLSMRCDPRSGPGRCQAFVFFGGIR